MTRRAKPPPPPGSERRQHPRYEVLAQVEIRGEETALVVPVRNVSVGGMYVDLESHDPDALGPEIAPGQCAAVFLDAGGEDASLSVTREAEILRIDRFERGTSRGGIAMRWTPVAAEEAERFERILQALRQRGGPGEE